MSKPRNIGIDLLRSLSMLMVVILHILGQGGILNSQAAFSPGYYVAWFMELLCFCAVNCFGLISGFVSFDRPFKLRNGISHWVQVAFYSVGITVLFMCFFPDTVGIRDILRSFLPVLTQKYWYFTAYFGLMFFIPYLNMMIQSISLAQTRALLFTLIIVFTAFPMLSTQDIFFVKAGYSFLWIAILYLIGACLGKIDGRWDLPWWKCLIGYMLCVSITLGGKLFFPIITTKLIGDARYENLLVSYASPTILLSAIFLLSLFKNLTIKNYIIKRSIQFVSPLAFGVYLIHTHPLVWNYLLSNRFSEYSTLPIWFFVPVVIFTAVGIFIFCATIDLFRLKLFGLLEPVAFKVTKPLRRFLTTRELQTTQTTGNCKDD